MDKSDYEYTTTAAEEAEHDQFTTWFEAEEFCQDYVLGAHAMECVYRAWLASAERFKGKGRTSAEDVLNGLAAMVYGAGASFRYTTDDDGIHIALNGKEIYAGWMDAESLMSRANTEGVNDV